MAIFHATGAVVNLVLHDGEKVWARAVDGIIELGDVAAKRFRDVAGLYGFVEQVEAKAPKRPAQAKHAEQD